MEWTQAIFLVYQQWTRIKITSEYVQQMTDIECDCMKYLPVNNFHDLIFQIFVEDISCGKRCFFHYIDLSVFSHTHDIAHPVTHVNLQKMDYNTVRHPKFFS